MRFDGAGIDPLPEACESRRGICRRHREGNQISAASAQQVARPATVVDDSREAFAEMTYAILLCTFDLLLIAVVAGNLLAYEGW
jgi:hypothetical protein